MKPRVAYSWCWALTIAIVIAISACQTYYAPPEVTIVGATDGLLQDPAAPLVLSFSKAVDPTTITLEVIKLDVDDQNRLPDERGDPNVTLQPIYSYDPIEGDHGGTSTLSTDARTFTIQPAARLPVGTKLVIVVEPGLTSTQGSPTRVRKRVLFSYAFSCNGGVGTQAVVSGVYFLLLDVQDPVPSQIQLYGALDVDPKSGLFTGQFTNADRITDPTRCSPACGSGQVCETLPAPSQCVVPSQRAGSVDEYPDFYPNEPPPTGYTVTVTGCAEDQPDGTTAFATAPADLVVVQPPVSIDGLVLSASFSTDASGVLRGSGAVTGDQVLFGTTSLGKGDGTATARLIPPNQVPPNVPQPPTSPNNESPDE